MNDVHFKNNNALSSNVRNTYALSSNVRNNNALNTSKAAELHFVRG